jgi:hypothetical protein
MRWRYILLAGILIVCVVCVYLYRHELEIVGPAGSEPDANLSSEQNAAAHPAHITWQQVDRAPDGFKVEMPTDIRQIQIPAYNGSGGTEQVDMISSYPDSDTSFSVAWADHPPVERVNGAVPERILDMARDGALARTQTTLISESRTSRQGYPARDFAGRNEGGGVFNARLILAGSRLYMLIAAFPSSGARRNQDVARFFDSFSVAPAARTD